jgi:hypothetical protein
MEAISHGNMLLFKKYFFHDLFAVKLFKFAVKVFDVINFKSLACVYRIYFACMTPHGNNISFNFSLIFKVYD